MNHYILLLTCTDRPGIVNEITSSLLHLNANIIDADQHSTNAQMGTFFIRFEFVCLNEVTDVEVQKSIRKLEASLDARIKWFKKEDPLHCSVLVSKEDHCLQEILYQCRSGQLNIKVDSIISNHDEYKAVAEWYNIPFYHIPSTSKHDAEKQIIDLTTNTDMLIMARYMQILSAVFLHDYKRPVVNIHHSFLPSFPGAKPYHQAFERGVKLIGATAHYATEDLDEGPIIVQKVSSVTHRDHVDDLKRLGRQLEKQCLVEALEAISEHRVIVHQNKTIVF